MLALLPTVAFVHGLVQGIRRALADPVCPDTPLLLLVLFSLMGYVFFTWGNPWFATVKGAYLLGLSVPFAYYASEALASWSRVGGSRGNLVLVLSGVFAVASGVVFTIGLVFTKTDGPGLIWQNVGMIESVTQRAAGIAW